MLGGVGAASGLSSVQAYAGVASLPKDAPNAAAPPRTGEDSTVVELSAAGKAAAAAEKSGASGSGHAARSTAGSANKQVATGGANLNAARLSPAELQQVEKLKARDRAVRAHEQAHQAAAGGLATGGASYTYQRGPDGVNYAIGGEVPISLSEGRTPEATIDIARTVRAAALAPADPSPQDRAVAAEAGQLEARALAELAAEKSAEETGAATAAAGNGPKPAGTATEAGTEAEAGVGAATAANRNSPDRGTAKTVNGSNAEQAQATATRRDAQAERTSVRLAEVYGRFAGAVADA